MLFRPVLPSTRALQRSHATLAFMHSHHYLHYERHAEAKRWLSLHIVREIGLHLLQAAMWDEASKVL